MDFWASQLVSNSSQCSSLSHRIVLDAIVADPVCSVYPVPVSFKPLYVMFVCASLFLFVGKIPYHVVTEAQNLFLNISSSINRTHQQVGFRWMWQTLSLPLISEHDSGPVHCIALNVYVDFFCFICYCFLFVCYDISNAVLKVTNDSIKFSSELILHLTFTLYTSLSVY